MKKIFFSFLLCLGNLLGQGKCIVSQDKLIIRARILSFSQPQNLYTATDQVHITQPLAACKKRELFADHVTYDQNSGRVKAIGKVILKDAEGSVSYSDALEITDDMKEGVIDSFRLISSRNERILANSAERKQGSYSAFHDASYTPCKVCDKEDAFWQLNASEVVHDQETNTISYYHATLRMGGVPVFYTPYFSHADPSVKRKSGLLRPSFGHSTDTGLFLSEPYFYVIDDYSDLTITPVLMTKENPIIHSTYRKNFTDGNFQIAGSYIHQKNPLKVAPSATPVNAPDSINAERWHVLSQLNYDIDEKQRFRLKVNRASDTTYLVRYPFIVRDTTSILQNNQNLTSNMIYERFNGNEYSTVKGFVYQTTLPKTTPVVLPDASYQYFSKEKIAGGSYSIAASLIGLTRQWGVPGLYAQDTGRLSLGSQWLRPFLLDSGHLFSLGLSVRGDAYYTKGFDSHRRSAPTSANLYNLQKDSQKMTGRFFPQASLDWRYPLISSSRNYIVEPKAMVVVAAPSTGSKFIPNNDSRTFTLDDTTLFLPNRFDGIDNTDSGRRAVYGVEQKFYFQKAKSISWFIGHSARLDHEQILDSSDLGENNRYSDIVNRFKLQPYDYVSLRYRNAMDVRTRRQRFMEVGALFGKPIAAFDIGYAKTMQSNLTQSSLSQMNWRVSSKINEAWTLSYAEIRDFLRKNKGPLKQFMNVAWENDCFKFELGVFKSVIRVQDVTTNQGFMFQVSFKNLGAFKPLSSEAYGGSILSHF